MKLQRTIKFNLGDPVILKTEPEVKRIVTGFMIRQKGMIYGLTSGDSETWHQEIEIEKQPDKKKAGFK